MTEKPEGVKPHQTLTAYYATDEERQAYLNSLFNVSARHYDRIMHYGFLGQGGKYRLRALHQAGLKPDMRLLDVACGTGAVLTEAAKVVPLEQIVCLDPSEGMLAEAQSKFPGATYWKAMAESIPSDDAAFDFVVMGYALRHVETLEAAFREFHRVLKPGGRVLILEISRPRPGFAYHVAKLYLKYLLPALALLMCRDREAHKMMRYYWDSIDACASRETILAAMERAGFYQATLASELGLFSAFSGQRPGNGSR